MKEVFMKKEIFKGCATALKVEMSEEVKIN